MGPGRIILKSGDRATGQALRSDSVAASAMSWN